ARTACIHHLLDFLGRWPRNSSHTRATGSKKIERHDKQHQPSATNHDAGNIVISLNSAQYWRQPMGGRNMRTRFSWLGAAVLVLALSSIVLAAQAAKVDVTGTWIFMVESAAGSSSPTLIFKQEGEKLTGKYSSQLMGDVDLTGSVKGQTIEFVVSS